MSEIKHLLSQNGTEEIFLLIVTDSEFAGEYVIEKPDSFEESDCVVDVNEDYFNIDNLIIGETEKITFLEYSNPVGYNIVKKVYDEKGNDGVIFFKWKAKNGDVEYDLLGDGYQLNLNKYSHKFDKSMMKIETEIKKREMENKFITREDVSVNLFSEKDLDNEIAPALVLEEVYFKEGSRKKGNFYLYDLQQYAFMSKLHTSFQFVYRRSDEPEIGDNNNDTSGWYVGLGGIPYKYYGVPLSTITELSGVEVEISNMHVYALRFLADPQPNFELNAVIKNGATVVRKVWLADFVEIDPNETYNIAELKILNQVFEIGNLQPNESIELLFESKDSNSAGFQQLDTQTSFEITANLVQPLKKTKVIRLKNAIERLARLYSGVDVPVESTIISPGGYYYNTAVSTGMFMRGLPDKYNTNKITTSFKTLFYDSASKLLALGFDLQDDKIIVEDISYFFKDAESYDFTGKEFIQDEFTIENDLENSYNQLIFGSKKYSTNKTKDLLNYNTKIEALSPLKSVKTKFDKTIDAIIDEDKIGEMILDKSTSTNDNDDDLIMFDVVFLENYVDEGILSNCLHYEDGGYLWLTCYENPFDMLPISVGGNLEITSGLNVGIWEILEIDKAKIKLNKTTGIQTGESETPIKTAVNNISKNRTNEGFSSVQNVKDEISATNLRHNPKYQMARWFPFYGSGLVKKYNSEEIITTNYKNNGDVVLIPNSADLANELQGETTLNKNESLFRLRENKDAFFSGESVNIKLHDVAFHEFIECYTNWRYGAVNRGYISTDSPFGTIKIYPFGRNAFSFNGAYNELTINGKIKNGSISDKYPILENVEIINENTISYSWNYNSQLYSEGNVLLQISTDNTSWTTLKSVSVVETSHSFSNSYFDEIMSGTTLYFRIVVNSKFTVKSNTLTELWSYNSVIFRQLSKNENVSCGLSTMQFEIMGNETVNIQWDFNAQPTGASARIFDLDTNEVLETFTSPSRSYLDGYNETKNSSYSITGNKRFGVEITSAEIVDGIHLTCLDVGNKYYLSATLTITVETADLSYQAIKRISVYGYKYDRKQ